VRVLLRVFALGVLRDRRGGAVTLATAFAAGLAIQLLPVEGALEDALAAGRRQAAGAEAPEERAPGPRGPPPSLRVEGAAPPWFEPLGFDAAEPPDVLLRIQGPEPWRFEVLPMHPEADPGPVREAVWDQVKAERRRRLAGGGFVERPWWVARPRIVQEPAAPAAGRLGLAALGAVLLASGMAMLNGALELLPRLRVSGFFESLMVAPIRARRIPLAVGLICWVVGLAYLAAALAGWLIGGLYIGRLEPGLPLHLAPLALAPLAAAAVLCVQPSRDLRGAYLRSFWWFLSVSTGAGLSAALLRGAFAPAMRRAGAPAALADGGEWLAALTPLGGQVALLLGWLPAGADWLAAGAGLAGAGALLARAGRRLEAEDPMESSQGAATRRRARGDFKPEAALLFAIGLAGVTAWSPLVSAGTRMGALVGGQIAFMALPALLSPRALALPRRALLSLGRPSARAVLLAPLVAAGSLSISSLAVALQPGWLAPSPSLARRYEALFQGMDTGGAVALLGLVPGTCEELLFRGAILGLLLRGGHAGRAVVLQAAAFALAHVFAFKLLPTFAAGLLFGALVVRCGSIWPAILAHALHNIGAALLPVDLSTAGPELLAGAAALSAVGLAAAALSGERT